MDKTLKDTRYNKYGGVLFILWWALIGFAGGVGVLLGPLRWVLNIVGAFGSPEWLIDLAAILVIVLWIVSSAALAYYTVIFFYSLVHDLWKLLLAAFMIGLLSLSLWLMLNPQYWVGTPFQDDYAGARFIFGPYPTQKMLWDMKKQGIDGVISLLHPAIIPFEPKLLKEEAAMAKKAGLMFISLPMLPWVGEKNNEASLLKFEHIVERGQERYYVNCYLGKDRVSVLRRIVEGIEKGKRTVVLASETRIGESTFMERGQVIRLAEGIYLIPHPTDDEFSRVIINSDVQQVVSLLDPENAGDLKLIRQERRILGMYKIPYILLPLSNTKLPSRKRINAIRHKLLSLPRPLVVHAFRTNTPKARMLIRAFARNRGQSL